MNKSKIEQLTELFVHGWIKIEIPKDVSISDLIRMRR